MSFLCHSNLKLNSLNIGIGKHFSYSLNSFIYKWLVHEIWDNCPLSAQMNKWQRLFGDSVNFWFNFAAAKRNEFYPSICDFRKRPIQRLNHHSQRHMRTNSSLNHQLYSKIHKLSSSTTHDKGLYVSFTYWQKNSRCKLSYLFSI